MADKQRTKFNVSRRKKIFRVGDIVWLNNRTLITGKKGLRVTKTGPYIVEAVEASKHTAVLRHIETQVVIKRRLSLLSSAQEDFSKLLINEPLENQFKLEPESTD